jgi:glycosyltransferase involved in cell wall biosynthesis
MQDLCVLYDTAVLGMAQISTHRTGTVRATEELARALQKTPGCNLQLMASDFQGAAADYCHRWLPGVSFVQPSWQTATSRGLYRTIYPVKFMHDDTRNQPAVRAARFAIKGALAPFRPLLRRVPTRTLQRADVYHAPSGVVPRQIQARDHQATGRKLPVFVTVHDLLPIKHPEYFSKKAATAAEAWLARFSRERWYLCSSENTRRDLLETGRCDPQRVFVTPLAANEEFYPRPEAGPAIRAKYGLGDAPYFLSVCTLEPRKNLDTVIRTFLKLVREENRQLPAGLKLVLVGTLGWMHEKIHAAYAGAGDARERIVFAGHVPEADLPALYSHALAFVYLSFYEGFGLPVLEAMRCGAPVVASNTSSLPEVVGTAGILQDPRDEDALAQNLQMICNDPMLRAGLSQRAVEQAATFSWDHCAKLTFAAYMSAVAGGR